MTSPQIISTIEDMKALSAKLRDEGKAVGLAPTMGALHEGHLSLVRRAAAETDFVVVSVYVNPTQFGPSEDFDAYPRQLQADAEAAGAAGAQAIFAPADKLMYPDGFCTYVTQERLTEPLCGARRPGHFRGVTTVCAKLFNIVRPHKAYFGLKDYQQCKVIQRMVADLDMDLEIVPCPIVREPDGLAMSSRNKYLSPDERQQALCLREALLKAQDMAAAGERCAARIIGAMREVIDSRPAAKVDYVSIVDPETLEDVEAIEGRAVAALAVFMGGARLIDNDVLGHD